jgi:hypothetical protein
MKAWSSINNSIFSGRSIWMSLLSSQYQKQACLYLPACVAVSQSVSLLSNYCALPSGNSVESHSCLPFLQSYRALLLYNVRICNSSVMSYGFETSGRTVERMEKPTPFCSRLIWVPTYHNHHSWRQEFGNRSWWEILRGFYWRKETDSGRGRS